MERTQPGKRRIEDALMQLLGTERARDISVSELCRAARVSRSTFYAHFANVGDAYRELVRRFIFGTSAMRAQLKAAAGVEGTVRPPLCTLLRDGGPCQGLVDDDAFVETYLELCETEFQEQTLGIWLEVCPDVEVARTLCRFQLMGCIAAAKAAGGLGAFEDGIGRVHPRRPECRPPDERVRAPSVPEELSF